MPRQLLGFTFLAFFFSFSLSYGQDKVQLFGALPGVLLRGDLGKLEYSFGGSSEMNAFSKQLGERSFPAEIINMNLEAALSYNSGPDINFATGFLYRFNDPFSGDATKELRSWQQITFINRLNKFRIRNRFRLEERWRESSGSGDYQFDIRLRYRISTDFPLSGERLDNREFYLNLSNEMLIMPTIDRPLYFWDYRIYAGLGYQFNERQRLEPALEFRTRRIDDRGNRRHFLFLRLQWIAKLTK